MLQTGYKLLIYFEQDDKAAAVKDTKEADSKETEKEVEKPKEPEFELLQNPTRVIKPQVNIILIFLQIFSNSNYYKNNLIIKNS